MAVAAGAEFPPGIRSRSAAAMAGLAVIKPGSRCLGIKLDEVTNVPVVLVPDIGSGLNVGLRLLLL